MSWRDIWELLFNIEEELPENFTARQLLDALQKRASEKLVEELK